MSVLKQKSEINGCQCGSRYSNSNSKNYKISLRTKCLAKPPSRRMRNKFEQPSVMRYQRKIEIIREAHISTRLAQLAIRPVRYLISTSDALKSRGNQKILQNLNMEIQKSAHSLYSRLGNVLIVPEIPTPKWTQRDWDRHNKWLEQNAMPKEVPVEIIVKYPKRPLDVARIKKLAIPRSLPKKLVVKKKRKSISYVATDRIKELSVPSKFKTRRKYDPLEPNFDTVEDIESIYESGAQQDGDDVPINLYKNIKATELKKLCEPRHVKKKFVKIVNNSWQPVVALNALKHVAKQRTITLAEPRQNPYKSPFKQNPYLVPKTALKQLSPKKAERYAKLAIPRGKATDLNTQ